MCTRRPPQEAAAAAISSPLLDFPIEKAKGVVFNIVGGNDLTLQEINAAAEVRPKGVCSLLDEPCVLHASHSLTLTLSLLFLVLVFVLLFVR